MIALADACALLGSTLRCPACRSRLLAAPDFVACTDCRCRWSRPPGGYVDLRAPTWNPDAHNWQDRQDETCRYYAALKTTPGKASDAFRSDFRPFAPVLMSYGGSVLDVGGGNGLARAFMSASVHYVSLDPSVEWLADGWDALRDAFACLAAPLTFVQGFAESLPFATASFDAAVCLWTLNHCASPAQALHEVGRVVRPAGRFLLVVEDGEPTWPELMVGVGAHYLIDTRARLIAAKAVRPLLGWPTQSDHLAISNRAMRHVTAQSFALRRRWWVGCYLALEYERR
jgi:SAM-dependent methyltransferase